MNAIDNTQNSTPEDNNDIELEDEFEEGVLIDQKLKALRAKLRACEKEKRENLEGWQRARADLINTRRSFEEERRNVVSRAREEFMIKMLPVFDALDIAKKDLENQNNIDESWKAGFDHITTLARNILKGEGVEIVEPQTGDKVDERLHEVVATEDVKGVSDGTIARVVRFGYVQGKRVIRPAHVIVASSN